MNKITSCISDTLRSGAGLIPPKSGLIQQLSWRAEWVREWAAGK